MHLQGIIYTKGPNLKLMESCPLLKGVLVDASPNPSKTADHDRTDSSMSPLRTDSLRVGSSEMSCSALM